MNTQKVLLLTVTLLSLLAGCSPEVGLPEDFQRHLKLVEKGELVQKEAIIDWLGEPERIIKISNIISETEHFRDYKKTGDKERAEADVQFSMNLWYGRYADAKGILIEDNSKWASDKAFMDSNVWIYYFETPLEVKVAYQKWIGTSKQATLKESLFFIQIDEDKFLAVPSLKRK